MALKRNLHLPRPGQRERYDLMFLMQAQRTETMNPGSNRRRCYSFLFHTCNLGDGTRVRRGVNPATGIAFEAIIDDGLSSVELAQLQTCFHHNDINGPEPDFEGYARYWANGTVLRLRSLDFAHALGVPSVCVELTATELSDDVLQLLLQISEAGNLAFMSSIGDAVRFSDSHMALGIQARYPDAKPIGSLSELRQWLEAEA